MTRRYSRPVTIFVDQDGPLYDFEKAARAAGLRPSDAKMVPGFYRNLPPTEGAQAAIEELHAWRGVQLFVATKIPDHNPRAAWEKMESLREHFPWFEERVIVTPNKACLGTSRDTLIDDRPHKADAAFFPGEFIVFGSPLTPSWKEVMARLCALHPSR